MVSKAVRSLLMILVMPVAASYGSSDPPEIEADRAAQSSVGDPCTTDADCSSGLCGRVGNCTNSTGQPCSCNIQGTICVSGTGSLTCPGSGGTCTCIACGVNETICGGACVPESPTQCGTDCHTCDDGNACTTDSCSAGVCQHSNNDAASCDDGIACTRNDRCSGGTCVGVPNAGACDDGNVCTADICNPASGCMHAPVDGTSCSDGNGCTQSDVCLAGACVGTPVVCTASDQCHDVGTCDPATGICSDPAKPDNSGCSGGGLCCGGACTAVNVNQTNTDRSLYSSSVKAGYLAGPITNCGQCGTTGVAACDDGKSWTTDLCVAGACQHYSRAQCYFNACANDPSGTPLPFDADVVANAVAAGAVDADKDRLFALWEMSLPNPYTGSSMPIGIDGDCDGEITFTAPDLVLHETPMGEGQPDFYLEVDFMEGGGFIRDPILGVIPEVASNHKPPAHPVTGQSALTEVAAVFKRAGITMHILETSTAAPHSQMVYFPVSPQGDNCDSSTTDPVTGEQAVNFYDYKSAHPDSVNRNRLYHYLGSYHSFCGAATGTEGAGEAQGSSGAAAVGGNSAVVATAGLLGYYLANKTMADTIIGGDLLCFSGDEECVSCADGSLCGDGGADLCGNGSACTHGTCNTATSTCYLSGAACASSEDCNAGDTCVNPGPTGVCVSAGNRLATYLEWVSTTVHELGHNGGLCHFAPALNSATDPCSLSTNWEPNHLSVMNYAYQLGSVERCTLGDVRCPFVTSPYSDSLLPKLRADYSHGLRNLDETSLDETAALTFDTVSPYANDIVVWKFVMPDGRSGPWSSTCETPPCGSGLNQEVAAVAGHHIDWNRDQLYGTVAADIGGGLAGGDGAQTLLNGTSEWNRYFTKLHCALGTQIGAAIPAGLAATTASMGEISDSLANAGFLPRAATSLAGGGTFSPTPSATAIELDPQAGRWEAQATYPHVLPSLGWTTIGLFSTDTADATQLTNLIASNGAAGCGAAGYNRRFFDVNNDGRLDLLFDADMANTCLGTSSAGVVVSGTLGGNTFQGSAPIQVGSRVVRETVRLNVTDNAPVKKYCPGGTASCTLGPGGVEIRLFPYSGSATPQSQLAARFSSGSHRSLCHTHFVKEMNTTNDTDRGECYAGFLTTSKHEQIIRWVDPRSKTSVYSQKTWTPDRHNTDKNGVTSITVNVTIIVNADGSVTVQGSQAQQLFPPGVDPYNR